jgi:hypothetical protein
MKTSAPENVTVHYLAALQGAYRMFYVLNLLVDEEYRVFDLYDLLAGVIQVTLSAVALRKVITTHKTKGSTSPGFSDRTVLQLLHLLRSVQLGATAINGYIFCYLVWSHNYHYCTYYPESCTPNEMEYIKVPWPLTLMVTTVRRLRR